MKKFFYLFALLSFFVAGKAQNQSSGKQGLPSIEDKTKDLKKYEGFFNFYFEQATGKIFLEVDKLDSEILYLVSLPAGLGSNDIGLDRGIDGPGRIVKFVKEGPKILLEQPNYNFRAVTTDENEKRAVAESFAQSILWGFTIDAVSNDHYLVDATDFLLRDAMQVANRLRNSKQGNYSIDKSRSAIYLPYTRDFPMNSEIETTITFVNSDGNIGRFVQSVTPSADAITLRMHHSFVQLPDNDYQPRVFDPRSGYFNISYMDYSTPISEPINKYFICRHRLKKKDPNAKMSEPVNPIIYYLDNGTPEPIRSALLEGASWWNQAFEAAGYINAFQVKVLPDDADPMDIRYNMINWVHRSTRGWSYGASVVDPRTGEIIKGNVTLGSLRVRQDYLIAQALLAPFENGTAPADDKMMRMALARLNQLAAHEVGHTLGLQHNYIASTDGNASVMDYPHPMVQLTKKGKIDLDNAYTHKIGDWDKVCITWGYQDFPKGTDENAALNKILNDAQKKHLEFLTDQDARPAGSLHPQTHLWDNGSNAVDELKNVMKIREKALDQFGENNIRSGMPMAMLEDVLVPVYFYNRYQIEAASKTVGGMFYAYTLRGDGRVATQPVSKQEQERALNTIIDCIDPKVLALPDRIVKLIPPRPSGYRPTSELFERRTGLAFDALSPAETAADFPFSFLFNSERLNRMLQFETETGGMGITEMVNSLIDKTWKAPRRNGMEGLIQMQTEQVLLTYLLSSGINDNNSFLVKAVLQKAVSDLKTFIDTQIKSTTNDQYKAHLMLALERMKTPEKAVPTIHMDMPPGAPIGCDWDEE
ncbi:MAG: zinc-dependent metalloprotease [Bacteroidetes bacterium]|nr:zinc-dependent metalloprotease [Bacteroidota bacterium]MBS1929778.1 zinc-dependent metalloprotease [Bacteroidota bacterium]